MHECRTFRFHSLWNKYIYTFFWETHLFYEINSIFKVETANTMNIEWIIYYRKIWQIFFHNLNEFLTFTNCILWPCATAIAYYILAPICIHQFIVYTEIYPSSYLSLKPILFLNCLFFHRPMSIRSFTRASIHTFWEGSYTETTMTQL